MTAVEILEKIRAKQDEIHALTLDLAKVLAGEKTAGQDAAALLKVFGQLWAKRYGAKFVANGAKDVGMLKRLLAASGMPTAEVEARMRRYLGSADQFVVRLRHPLGYFISNINTFAPVVEASSGALFDDDDQPVACGHKPPCRSDAAHTARMLRERRQ